MRIRKNTRFREAEHPRGPDGKFTESGAGTPSVVSRLTSRFRRVPAARTVTVSGGVKLGKYSNSWGVQHTKTWK